MRACVFVGPTLRAGDLAAAGEIVVLPPVAQGDVYRAAQRRPQVIGIIDGYFEGVLSVWHKEILWAMTQGIHVVGSASMGALRAAELHAFGMRGVGRIFEAYRDGVMPPDDEAFEDDDEVAVIHGPAETGYVALSEAMVSMRRTFAAAALAGIIQPATRDTLAGIAKGLFYQERTYERVLELARPVVARAELAALDGWLPEGRVDQKREDALAMLAAMQALLASDPAPMRCDFVLEWTRMWDEATITAGGGTAAGIADDRILEELRLEADTHVAVRDRALLRFLAHRDASRRRQAADPGAVRRALGRLRARHGLLTRADLERWLAAHHLDAAGLERLMAAQAQLESCRAETAPAAQLLDELRLRGDYLRLAERARNKQALLEAVGLDQPPPEAVGAAPLRLLAWHFEHRLGRPLPDDIDAAARELGFDGMDQLYRALRREWLYCRETSRSPQT